MTLWLFKDERNDYFLFKNDPAEQLYKHAGVWRGVAGSLWSFCGRGFEINTGIKLEEGQLTKVEVKQVGDVWDLISEDNQQGVSDD